MNIPTEFIVGDVVTLRSGGPLMTATDHATDEKGRRAVECSWFDAGRLRCVHLLPEVLYRVPPEQLKWRPVVEHADE